MPVKTERDQSVECCDIIIKFLGIRIKLQELITCAGHIIEKKMLINLSLNKNVEFAIVKDCLHSILNFLIEIYHQIITNAMNIMTAQ